MLGLMNLMTLAVLGYTDFVSYKIPNAILCGWLGTLIFFYYLGSVTPRDIIPIMFSALIVSGSYIPLRRIVKCSAGDFKLFAVLTVAIGLDNMLTTLLITSLLGLFPLACGLKRIPIAFITCFGYIAFLLMNLEV